MVKQMFHPSNINYVLSTISAGYKKKKNSLKSPIKLKRAFIFCWMAPELLLFRISDFRLRKDFPLHHFTVAGGSRSAMKPSETV